MTVRSEHYSVKWTVRKVCYDEAMIDDKTLKEAIEESPLSQEDKIHWLKLLVKLNPNQRERLHHSLTAKTEIAKAISLIERALDVIASAEKEAEEEVKREDETSREKQELLQDLEEIKDKEGEILMDEEELKKKQEETKNQIQIIRDELRKLSLEVHGVAPPSYQTPLSPPSSA